NGTVGEACGGFIDTSTLIVGGACAGVHGDFHLASPLNCVRFLRACGNPAHSLFFRNNGNFCIGPGGINVAISAQLFSNGLVGEACGGFINTSTLIVGGACAGVHGDFHLASPLNCVRFLRACGNPAHSLFFRNNGNFCVGPRGINVGTTTQLFSNGTVGEAWGGFINTSTLIVGGACAGVHGDLHRAR